VLVRRTARRANVKPGIHILRHSFCSHLAMRGAPARAIQELAGHQDLGTTQRYMHLSPAALDAAIRLLETGTDTSRVAVEKWWRRRESNPRPRVRPRGTLHACPLLNSHARREEAAQNRQAPDPVHLTTGGRAALRSPACLMTSGPQPPGEVRADAHCLLSSESVLSIRS